MTLVLTPTPPRRSQPELVLRLSERLSGAREPAAAAVEVLSEALPNARSTIFRYEPETQSAVVLATSANHAHGPAVGARVLLQQGLMASAVRVGTPQRVVDSYLDPDFAGSQPGEPRSVLAVPFGGERCAGLIRLEYPSSERPGVADEEVAQVAGALLAVALRPGPAAEAPSPDGAERQRRQQAVLSATAAHLAQSNDIPRSVQRLAESATELLQCGGAMLLLRHASHSVLEVGAVAGVAPAAPGDTLAPDGLVGTVLQTAQPRSWPTSDELGLLGAVGDPAPVRDALVVPLIAGGRPFGTLVVVDSAEQQPFSSADVEVLQHLANQSAGLESIRLLQPLRQRLSDSSIIAEVGRAVTGTLGLDEVLALVVRAAEMLAGAQGAAVALVDDRSTHVSLEAASGSLMLRQSERLPLHGSLLGWVARTGEAVIAPSVAADSRAGEQEQFPGAGVVVPIEARECIHGVLFAVRSPNKDVPSDADLDALRKLAAYAAIAIDNARLYREQLQLSAALRAQATELEKAYADLSDSQERLMVAEKMAALGRVTAGIAHEINSPLGGILNCLQMAQSYVEEYRNSIGDPDVTPDDHLAIATDLLEAITLAEQSGKKVAQFVRSIKNQTRMDDSQRGSFDPAEEINGTLALLQHELRNRNVTLQTELEPGLRLQGDPGKFALVLQNLLTNAIDAYEQQAGQVAVRLRRSDAGLVMEVEDHGSGIPEEIRGKIYDYMFTTKDVGQGTGLGLSMVHSIVTSHFEGQIDLRSEVGSGTTFYVTFPAPAERV